MKKRLLRLLSIAILLMIVSCAPYGGTLVYRFKFFNNSSRDIYIIIDNNTKDNIISAGSICDFVYANAWCYIDSGTPWSNIIKDSAYVYVIDTDLFDFDLTYETRVLSQEKCNSITNEMILDRITVYNKDTHTIFSLYYPSGH
jgi:hypothetical protein